MLPGADDVDEVRYAVSNGVGSQSKKETRRTENEIV